MGLGRFCPFCGLGGINPFPSLGSWFSGCIFWRWVEYVVLFFKCWPQYTQVNPVLSWSDSLCLFSPLLSTKWALHKRHLYGFSPVCLLICTWSADFVTKVIGHLWHEWSRMSMCHLRWDRKSVARGKIREQTLHSWVRISREQCSRCFNFKWAL